MFCAEVLIMCACGCELKGCNNNGFLVYEIYDDTCFCNFSIILCKEHYCLFCREHEKAINRSPKEIENDWLCLWKWLKKILTRLFYSVVFLFSPWRRFCRDLDESKGKKVF